MFLSDELTVVILTFNEEVHIRRCLNSIHRITKNVIVIDSHSTDKTRSIARSLGASVVKNKWPGTHSRQLSWGLENLKINTNWVMRLDADEYLSDELIEEISQSLPSLVTSNVNGIYLKRRNIFMGKELRFGGMGGTYILRIWRNMLAVPDDRVMDEQIKITSGTTIKFNCLFYDHNLMPISIWSQKHIDYAMKESAQYMSGFYEQNLVRSKVFYYKAPPIYRATCFFLYRYIFRLGFLDGKPGFVWCLLQCLWYRTLVDLLVSEGAIDKKC